MDSNDVLVTQRATNNPYINAAKLVLRRLRWDVRPASWQSRAKLKDLRNRYAGGKAVILCNGPSLLKSDLSLLDRIFTFGLNKINLLFDKSTFRPSCIVAVNPLVLQQNAAFFRDTDIPLFLESQGLPFTGKAGHITYLHDTPHRYFAKDCCMSIYTGPTVTYTALQLAFHMGFSDVALIGADHSFAVQGPANKTVVAGEKDESHFDPNYFAAGTKWQLPDLFESEVSYTMAKHMFEAHDRRVFNATEGGELDVFPRISLKQFVCG